MGSKMNMLTSTGTLPAKAAMKATGSTRGVKPCSLSITHTNTLTANNKAVNVQMRKATEAEVYFLFIFKKRFVFQSACTKKIIS